VKTTGAILDTLPCDLPITDLAVGDGVGIMESGVCEGCERILTDRDGSVATDATASALSDAASSDSSSAVDDASFLDLLVDTLDGEFDPTLFF